MNTGQERDRRNRKAGGSVRVCGCASLSPQHVGGLGRMVETVKTLRSCFYLKVKGRKGEQEKERVRGFIVSVLISWFRQQV